MEEKVKEETITLEQTLNEQNKGEKLKKRLISPYVLFSVLGFIGALSSIGMGFYKMFFYTNYSESEYLSNYNVNAYVGGDAYNYIINGTYTTSYFVLALVFTVFACTMLILKKINVDK